MVKTLSTTDYSIFKKHPSNRPVNESALKRLEASIKSKNLLEYRPLLVDGNMFIIDGQHRLEVAKRLGLPIYYQINEEVKKNEILILNQTVTLWKVSDYLNYFIAEGNSEYIKFRDFINKKGIDTRMGLRVLMNGNAGKGTVSAFKKGQFVFPSPEVMENVEEVFIKYNDIVELINTKKIKGNLITVGTHFKSALLDFLRNREIDYAAFKRRIEMNLSKIVKCADAFSYLTLFKEIYNWKNRDKIEQLDAINS